LFLRRRISPAALLVALLLTRTQAFGKTSEKDSQSSPSQSSQASAPSGGPIRPSIVVSANSTPEEVEDGKINDAYQSVYKLEEQNDCEGAIGKYRSVVIPLAEQAKFDVSRNKFLYLSYKGIGDCDLSAGRFAEAEEIFQKIFQYMPVWPGTNDSDYPINYRSVGLARMGQENWKGAEEPLQKAVSILDQQIESALHSDSDFMRTEHANNLRMSQDGALNLLAVAYFREQRPDEALPLLERAYNQAIKYHAHPTIVKQIVQSGVGISTAIGDSTGLATWSEREKASK
jgi:tetratricopeptide (TPR) repeat protein